ncbi:GH25 family lysozyme [Fructobacillus evanidus]|uniref:Lysozyme n=1 Tax=Fructobacillus evanidus TaxID=3064281 RepID=A0ABM9MRT7_9LACO|nr:Glucan-binding domain (YG repeat) [Fructobacillus sp. LMG 32999]CAK1234700.1 Glucan-binding domain (YG repeat) [Fructobacillus sp. LMG 32999]CAK1235879.1 Glucan-binding domain (YG repeat) [Fructobacillus sp. LMG 32999]CAK1238668.1 Glucan-binding domain (YG repeat) [Fructobacillus sp. LMG 32999]CAK1242769.1 Glucan-binding domain (YG repeat) [Fructobacillus sp. LMG 32999]
MKLKKTWLALTAITALGVVANQNHLTVHADDIDRVTGGQSGIPRMDVVDISSNNGYLSTSDFQTMKNNGVKGIIVKLTEGTYYHNPYASSQITNAKSVGLKVSAYHYSTYSDQSSARAEANYFADYATQLGFASSDLLVNDLEDTSTQNSGVSANSQAFNDQLKSRGFVNGALYTYAYYKNSMNLNTSFLLNNRIWMAQYPYTPSANDLWNTQYGMWQWSSNAGFNGISGTFDVSMDYVGMATSSTGYVWDSSVNDYRWLENGQPYTGFQYYMGTYYYFDNGYRSDNAWHDAWGNRYYTGGDGRAVQGLQTIAGKQYYFGDDNTFNLRENQAVTDENQMYQADKDGVLQPWQGYLYDGSDQNGGFRWYENGQLYTGFRYYMGTYYWFVDGVRQNAGWRSAWGLTYWTDTSGRAVQGLQTIDGKQYYFGNDETYFVRINQTVTINNAQYKADGTGILTPFSGYIYDGSDQNGGYRWYENGQLYTGFRYYMGTYYWFVNGVRQNQGWRNAWGLTYWTDSDGRAVQGWQTIDGKSYYFGSDGTYYLR